MSYYKNQLNKFNTIYRRVNSVNGINDAYFTRKTKLGKIYMALLEELEKVKDYDSKSIDSNLSMRNLGGSLQIPDRTFWLFYDNLPEDYASRLMDVIATANDVTLSKSDYNLLLHASYENERMEGALKGIPLSMLYDVYTPVFEETYEKWQVAKLTELRQKLAS
jgi:hypothetical protein